MSTANQSIMLRPCTQKLFEIITSYELLNMLAQIALDVPLNTLFTYKIPENLMGSLHIGQRVLVNFRKKDMIGFCLKIQEHDEPLVFKDKKVDPKELKNILQIIENKNHDLRLDKNYLRWLRFASEHYCAPIGQVLSQAVPSFYLDVKKSLSVSKARASKIVIETNFKSSTVELTPDQEKIKQEILCHFNQYYPSLIHGITGSGKTEIYIQLIYKALSQNKSALFLVPEIGLTPQMLSRLNHHFKGKLLVYHSGLTKNQRLNQWNHCLENTPKIMIGTRSSLFCPLNNLGLIIVDEEHDTSYKQEDRFRYHARDLAVSRAKILDIPIILGSATPSLESYYQATQKKYRYFELKQRIGRSKLPKIRVVDYAREKEQTGTQLLVSQNIHQAIDHFYQNRQQMLIFVGQRGYAQNAFCVDCHQIQLCPNCSVGLKYHKDSNILKCHYCDYIRKFDEVCLDCHQKKLTLLGFGTQTIEEEIKSMHPSLVIKRLDSDAAPTAKYFNEVLNDFCRQKINMIIGTQMITKGHDFSNIAFVGILGIDAHLGLPEFRTNERTFQNIVQVAGRAGRADQTGHVIIQSLMPGHSSIQMGVEQDYKKFADHELQLRKTLQYPPFSRIIQLKFLSNQKERLKTFLLKWNPFLENIKKNTDKKDMHVLGPVEMPIAKVRGKHRYHVIFKVKRGLKTKSLTNYIIEDLKKRNTRGIQYLIDVDAMNLV